MTYLFLLEVLPLPNEIVEIIYKFMNVNAMNVISNYVRAAKLRHDVFVVLSFYRIEDFSANTIYSIANTSPLGTDKVIEDIYKYLTIMDTAHYPRTNYLKHDWANVLGNVSQILMYYYNRLAFSDCLKKKNINYVYLKSSIQLWFKLCKKYNLYLVLCYMKSAKKVDRNNKATQLITIKNFAEFRVSPLVT